MRVSLWATTADKVFHKKKYKKIAVFCLVLRKIHENAPFMTSQLTLQKSNRVTFYRFYMGILV